MRKIAGIVHFTDDCPWSGETAGRKNGVIAVVSNLDLCLIDILSGIGKSQFDQDLVFVDRAKLLIPVAGSFVGY